MKMKFYDPNKKPAEAPATPVIEKGADVCAEEESYGWEPDLCGQYFP
ncbi:hypothetical protein GWC95_13670 [Sediminibacterium roseum]|uniref:Uncharacterized protein n=1 Tax=Sediminibacterium roseum TaxID=1978412 RepID=A0ABW9ZXC4_9BACT|nr:hypothetical protein [Sediminibacterium roseum]NCI50977.1 hypothetical protein [Sediminibacterium roseum]